MIQLGSCCLEELELERDTIQKELTRAQSEFVKKETLLNDRITALETDNKLIETLETQALEYDAALSQKDDRLKKLFNELQLQLSDSPTSTPTEAVSSIINISTI